jgi:hypothetical protein
LGASIALETALRAGRLAASATVDVVVTGPHSAAPVRLTSEFVRQLIDDARHRITMVSYSLTGCPRSSPHSLGPRIDAAGDVNCEPRLADAATTSVHRVSLQRALSWLTLNIPP